MILSIDPGPIESAYVLMNDNLKPDTFGKINNEALRYLIISIAAENLHVKVAIEMIASYGMSVGKEVFDTCVWIGRFIETLIHWSKNMATITQIYRKDEKMNLCHSMKAKDSNIRQALIDRFGEVGTKKNPGWFYGFKSDIWQAYAVGVTYHDMYLMKEVS